MVATGARAVGRQVPTIGFLGESTAAGQGMGRCLSAAIARTRLDEGRNVAIEYRWAEGRNERFAELVAELVRLKVDIIVTQAPQRHCGEAGDMAIPIVFPIGGNPVANGLVASLAQPGGNATGLTNQTVDLAGKRIELLREILPGPRQLVIMANVDNPSVALDMLEVEATARTLGLEVATLEIRRAEDIAPAIEALRGNAQRALYVAGDPLVTTNRSRIAILALGARLPTAHANRENVDAGGLMSYGPNLPDLHRRAGDFVDKILKGSRVADLPVEQPTKFDLVINLNTAKALGLTCHRRCSPAPTR